MTIRPTRDQDAPALPAIERSAGEVFRQWPTLAWIADDTVQSADTHRALIARGVSLVAELPAHGIVGFLNGEAMPDALHLWQIAVRSDQQGQGIGRQLIAEAERLAMARGLPALSLSTFRDVPWNEPHYQRLGFVTLAHEATPPWLADILRAEALAGLPAAQRCAMMKRLTP